MGGCCYESERSNKPQAIPTSRGSFCFRSLAQTLSHFAFFCFPPSLLPEQNKLGEVGQEISAQKQKQSNMKSSGVCQGGGAEGPGSVGKRERERVLKLSLHYQQRARTQTHTLIHARAHTHARTWSLIAWVISHFRQTTSTFVKCSLLCECDHSKGAALKRLHGSSEVLQYCELWYRSTSGAGQDIDTEIFPHQDYATCMLNRL